MSDRAREFVANELSWLILLATMGLGVLVAMFSGTAGAVVMINGFVLCYLFGFWGDDIAAVLFGSPTEESEASDESEDDALAELKRRYAEGKIDDEEFERRLEKTRRCRGI